MSKRSVFWIGGISALALMVGGAAMSAQRTAPVEFSPLATPQGITHQPLGLAAGYSLSKTAATKLPRDKIVYANAEGLTFYTYDKDLPGQSTCVDECAKTWIPAVAPAGAVGTVDWSVIKRSDGASQWAFKNKPVYTYVGDKDPGSVGGNSPARYGRGEGIGPRGRTSSSIPKDKPLPEGWHAVQMYPVEDVALPGGFEIREVEDAMAMVLVDESTGKSLYAFNGTPQQSMKACATDACRDAWKPLIAPRIAFTRGDFGVGTREDGVTQWTYKGRALFTYSGDLLFGDANGIGAHKMFEIAAHRRYYAPPEVTVQHTSKLGKVLATATGQTLYRRNSHIFQSGSGHSLRRGDPIRPAVGRDLGTNPRCTIDCEKWRPFLAPADAKPWGDWGVMTREDGSKQWTQRGYALWTYDGDKAPGDINGNDSYQYVMSHDANTVVDVGTPIDGPWALLWIAAAP
ncbi:MAG: hypothetical protein AB7E79_04755 [Rhodospirillaceae bacterium]